MSDLESIAREYLEAFNRRDWDAYRNVLAPNYTYTGGDGAAQNGPEAGIAVAQGFAAAMSDARIEVKNVHVAGNTAIVEFQGSGTNDGDFMGIPATGKKITMPVCTVLDVKDGKIVAEREYMDMAHLMQQLGVMPEMATA